MQKTSLLPQLNFRPELDGIRSIAVFAVIIYHADFTVFGGKLLPGGYTGVDIFFVLSGYLISRILLKELFETGSISLTKFYARRIRRILPMLLIVIAAFMPFAYFLMLPNELFQFAESSMTAIFFLSNFYFSNITTVYGAESSLLKPMLHTWSLGVEEQFYICAPILMMLLFRFVKIRFVSSIIAVIVCSLLYAQLNSYYDQQSNFFLPLSRFWEMGCGTLIAFAELQKKISHKTKRETIFVFLGLFLLLLSFFKFDANTIHPGFNTLIPVTGVALLIYFSTGNTVGNHILSNKYLQKFGKMSYSLYLWHFPLFAFSYLIFQNHTNFIKISIIVLTFFLSALSHRFIEAPLRYRASKVQFISFISLLFLLVSVPLSTLVSQKNFQKYWMEIAPKTFSENFYLISDTLAETVLQEQTCKVDLFAASAQEIQKVFHNCRKQHNKAVVILGDSHGVNLYNAAHLSEEIPFLINLTQGGCRPKVCRQRTILDIAPLLRDTDKVVFHQSGGHFVFDEYGDTGQPAAFASLDYSIDKAGMLQTSEYLQSLAANLRAELIWLGPFPEYQYDPKEIVRGSMLGWDLAKYKRINPNSIVILENVENELTKVDHSSYRYIPFQSFYPVKNNANIISAQGKSCFQFRDEDHFSFCGEQEMASLANWGIFSQQE